MVRAVAIAAILATTHVLALRYAMRRARRAGPRGLIGRATAGRLRHVPAGATAAGYFAAFFLRSAQ